MTAMRLPSIIAFLLSPSVCLALPRVSDLAVVDLTAKAFRLVWNSGTDSRPEVDVYLNAAGSTPAPGITKTPFSLFQEDNTAINLATSEGVQEIQVTGLNPDTTYYVRARSVPVPSGSSAQSPLIQVRTAASPLLAMSGGAPAPFANPVLSLSRAPSTASYSAISTLLVVSTPAARSGTVALGNSSKWFVDLNSLISSATGTPLPLDSGTPLQATIYTGNAGARKFTLYTPDSDDLAEVRPPALSPDPPLNAHILSPASGLLLMEFASAPGSYYAVDRSASLEAGDWERIQEAVEADSERFFYSTNALTGDAAFYRTQSIDVLPPP